MIEAKIDITISIPELTAVLTPQEIKKFGGCMPIRNKDLEDDDAAAKAQGETATFYTRYQMNLQLLRASAKLLKDMCKDRDFCKGCLFYGEDGEGCAIKIKPELWRI